MIEKFQHIINEEIEKFSNELSVPPAELYEPVRYMLSLGGKRIRPLFVLIACDLFDGKTNDAVYPALAIELFHNFTLVHDDIMDNAPLRRSRPAVHAKWNNCTAILSGDAMMVKAYQLLGRSKMCNVIFPAFCEMAIKVCEGQQLDMNYEQLHKISLPQYFKMVELKTASLFAYCMKIGALIAGASEKDADNLFQFGKNTGIAFQLQDDFLDVYGETEKFGKLNGGDILANKKTFLLLKAIELSSLNPYKKEELSQWISFLPKNDKESKDKVEAVKSIYDFVNLRQITEKEMLSFPEKAIASLQKVKANENKKKALADFTAGLLKRET